MLFPGGNNNYSFEGTTKENIPKKSVVPFREETQKKNSQKMLFLGGNNKNTWKKCCSL